MKLLIKKPQELKNNWWFWTAYAIYMLFNLFCQSMYAQYLKTSTPIIYAIVWILLLFGEVLHRKTRTKEVVVASICLILFFITFRISSYGYATVFLLIFSSRNIDFKDIAKFTVWISLLSLFIIVVSAKLGIITDYVFTGYRDNGVYRDRHCLGFLYALYPPTIFFNITALEVYTKKCNIKLSEIIVLFAINYYLYFETDSRLCFATAILLIFYIAWRKILISITKRDTYQKKFYFLLQFSYILSFLISWGMTISYLSGNTFLTGLSESLVGRLRMNVTAINRYGISLFGKQIEFSGSGLNILGQKSTNEYFYVDNLYIQSLLHYGIVFLLIFIVLYTLALIKAYKKEDYLLMLILSLLAFHGIIDDLILSISFNSFMFSMIMIVAKAHIGKNQYDVSINKS